MFTTPATATATTGTDRGGTARSTTPPTIRPGIHHRRPPPRPIAHARRAGPARLPYLVLHPNMDPPRLHVGKFQRREHGRMPRGRGVQFLPGRSHTGRGAVAPPRDAMAVLRSGQDLAVPAGAVRGAGMGPRGAAVGERRRRRTGVLARADRNVLDEFVREGARRVRGGGRTRVVLLYEAIRHWERVEFAQFGLLAVGEY
mmetsp:Transcript_31268/g.66176  ORF Transcript_31268/g.66176 Transcript_31268/m.66176 type:complete len:200 (-) Transcript_31268:1828-2427(-)